MEIFELQLVSGQKRRAFNDGCGCPVKPRSVFEVSTALLWGTAALKEEMLSIIIRGVLSGEKTRKWVYLETI